MQIQVFFILSIVGIWLLGISIALIRIFSFFRKISKGVEVPDLKKVLEKFLADQSLSKKEFEELRRKIDLLEQDGKDHVQKIGLVRFNPFKELGGDHSFSLAILSGQDSGVIITGLHSRDRTRIYMKQIKKGKTEYELSNEEKRAFSVAQKK